METLCRYRENIYLRTGDSEEQIYNTLKTANLRYDVSFIAGRDGWSREALLKCISCIFLPAFIEALFTAIRNSSSDK